MRKARIELGGCLILLGMLLVSCATSSATAPRAAETTSPASASPANPQSMPAEDQEALRQYAIERNRFIYEDIFFAKNQYQLDEQARERLKWKADWLKANPGVVVIIEGHCGEGGNAENNMALGLRRAGEVKGFLLRQGVARARLTAVSYGSERPLAQGQGEEVQAKNRRVRLTIAEP